MEGISIFLSLKNLASFIFSTCKNFILYRALVGVLGWNKNGYSIFVPTFKREVMEKDEDVVLNNEVSKAFDMLNLISKTGGKLRYMKNSECKRDTEILIGGPPTNPKTQMYFYNHFEHIDLTVQKDDFLKKCGDYAYSQIEDNDYLVFDKNRGLNYQSNENADTSLKYVDGKIDYAIILKLHHTDFKATDKKRNVLMLFGLGRAGTEAAVDAFIDDYKKIYKEFKKKHFCLAYQVNIRTASVNGGKTPTDLTNYFFRENFD